MAAVQARGQCTLCGKEFAKSSMSRHLKSCISKHPEIDPKSKSRPVVHLVVTTPYPSSYFLHLLADAAATLDDLDGFLRHIWLECCGHMSEFEINGTRYGGAVDRVGDFSFGAGFGFGFGISDSESADVPLGRVLTPKSNCSYTYDFGSSTNLQIKLADFLSAQLPKGAIHILSRNNPPEYECATCGKPATTICGYCVYNGGVFCKSCLKKHECGDEAEMPIVNSPRTGVCGYVG